MKQERLNSHFLKVLPMSAEESGNGGRNLSIAYSFWGNTDGFYL